MNKKIAVVGIMAAIALLLGVGPAQAALISTPFDLGGNNWLVQIKYDGSGINTGTWTVPAGVLQLQVLVVGGGAGGACGGNSVNGMGGGGGGVYETDPFGVTGGSSFNIAVGAGGAGGTTASRPGTAGGTTMFGNLWATGGQGGLYNNPIGASSGGYSTDGGTTILGVVAGPINTIDGNGGPPTGGSGAGGQGTVGYGGAPGGIGLAKGIVSSTVAGTFGLPYNSGYYGGGGGAFGAVGGLGGGGQGHDGGGDSGTALLGGGGGAGGNSGLGGAGGSGVIYVAYQAAAIPEPSTLVLVGLGLLGTVFMGRRKHS